MLSGLQREIVQLFRASVDSCRCSIRYVLACEVVPTDDCGDGLERLDLGGDRGCWYETTWDWYLIVKNLDVSYENVSLLKPESRWNANLKFLPKYLVR